MQVLFCSATGEAAGQANTTGFESGLAGVPAAVTEALGSLAEGGAETEGAGAAAAEA